jgi:glycerophosphoryl diester phosphodiesterase
VTLAHRFGLLAFAWDAQEYRRIRAVLEMGVDAIYSDHVERLVAAVGEWFAPPAAP